jgi:hypothetical protein
MNSYHHMRYLDKTGNISQFGGVTFFGVYQPHLGQWEVSASATHPTDRFNRKRGVSSAKMRWMSFETFSIPAGLTPHFTRDLYAHLKTTNGAVSYHYGRMGVANMIRSTYQKVVKPPKMVVTDKVLKQFMSDTNKAMDSSEGRLISISS